MYLFIHLLFSSSTCMLHIFTDVSIEIIKYLKLAKPLQEWFFTWFFTCVAEGESRTRSAVTPSVCLSVPKSCHRNSSETTDPIIMKLGMYM